MSGLAPLALSCPKMIFLARLEGFPQYSEKVNSSDKIRSISWQSQLANKFKHTRKLVGSTMGGGLRRGVRLTKPLGNWWALSYLLTLDFTCAALFWASTWVRTRTALRGQLTLLQARSVNWAQVGWVPWYGHYFDLIYPLTTTLSRGLISSRE